jgi:hypothetical protein
MAKNIFQEKIIKASSKRLLEIEKAVVSSGSSFKNLLEVNRLIVFSLFFVFLAFLGVILAFSFLPVKIPLFYSLPWGEEQLVNKQLFFILPGLMLVFSLLNFILAKTIFGKNNHFLPIMICFFSFLLSFLGLITFVKIVFLMI